MFTKKFLQKATHHHLHHQQQDEQTANLKQHDLNPHIVSHLGIPNTASILAVDPIQQLIAIGTLDGRIKVLGGDNIEGLLISPKELPYKNLQFLPNQGYLVGILNDNDIQVWHLESRSLVCTLQWESNVTAFSVISGSLFMLVGDEYGKLSILKYAAAEGRKLVDMPYSISPHIVAEKTGILLSNDQPVVGVLPQPSCFGDRLVIAYQYGLIILWDVVEAEVVVYKGNKNLRIKGHLSDSSVKLDADLHDSEHEDMNEKEISALCWASSVGSVLAVGYVDGDILLWILPRGASSESKNTGDSCNDVVKLQLSSSGKRLPVIVLHWCETNVSQNSCGGQLFVYGGCEIGLEEVITIVSLEWSLGMEALKSVRRVDLSLNGAFADMAFLSSFGAASTSAYDGLFMLTRPAKLYFYDMEKLAALASKHERKSSESGIQFPATVPTSDPQITATQLSLLPCDGNLSVWLSEMTLVAPTQNQGERRKWPLTGGTPSEVSSVKEKFQRIIYIVGYQDGSVRVWDATNPIFLLLTVLEGQVHGIGNAGIDVAVTKLDFCETLMSLAVGSESGVVRVYSLSNDAEATKLHWVKNLEHEVYDEPPRVGAWCRAVFSLVNSAVQSLQFSVSGARLAVGFESGHVAVLDMLSPSILFFTELVASSRSPVISVILQTFSDPHCFSKSTKQLGPKDTLQPLNELMFALTKDAKVNVLDCKTGSSISTRPLHLKKQHTAISMYVLVGSRFTAASSFDQHENESSSEDHEQANKKSAILEGPKQDVLPEEHELRSNGLPNSGKEKLSDSMLLLCCENVLRVYHMKSVVQGDDKPARKVKLASACCWTSILRKDDITVLVLFFKSGSIELRSLPGLELLIESSLFSLMRWNYRPKMEKLAYSTIDWLISLVDGNEVAFISMFTVEHETRFLESLPLLHDKVVAVAADAAICHSLKQKKQVAVAGILGTIVKGLKKEKSKKGNEPLKSFSQLEEIFSGPVVPYLPVNTVKDKEDEEELDIDDIEIDEPVLAAAAPSNSVKGKGAKNHKEKLFESNPTDMKPRTRTPEEIMAAYKGTEYASAAAERARNKLLERQEKLERINQRSDDLRHEAEDFASMAHELVKTMERKNKWWKI